MALDQLLIGADPEFFIKKRRHIISAHPYPFGTKARPKETQHGCIQIDGIALECNVTPSKTASEFVTNVRGVLADLTAELQMYEPGAEVVAKPSIFMGHTRLAALPLYASELGCRPDYNAWTGQKNPSPDARSPIRTASGHIHVGWTSGKGIRDKDHFDECVRVAQQLDYYIGLPSLLWDKDTRRRTLYGRAGSFRPKPYGMEYRALSNAWVRTDRLVEWVFTATHTAVTQLFDGTFLPKQFGDLAQTYINANDTNWHKTHPSLAEEVLR